MDCTGVKDPIWLFFSDTVFTTIRMGRREEAHSNPHPRLGVNMVPLPSRHDACAIPLVQSFILYLCLTRRLRVKQPPSAPSSSFQFGM